MIKRHNDYLVVVAAEWLVVLSFILLLGFYLNSLFYLNDKNFQICL